MNSSFRDEDSRSPEDKAIDQLAELLLSGICPQCGASFKWVTPCGPDMCDLCWEKANPLSVEPASEDESE